MDNRNHADTSLSGNTSFHPSSSANFSFPSEGSGFQPSARPSQDAYSDESRPRLHQYPAGAQLDFERAVIESGVPPNTLRAWEYRYNIPPRTSSTPYKMYSWRDIAALRWLSKQMTTGQTLRQAITELARQEPTYFTDREGHPRTFALPTFHNLHELHDPLLRALASKDESGVERLLSDAFALHPPQAVCQQLLQPVLQKLIELRQQRMMPIEIEIFAVQVTQAQSIYLIESGIAPKDAQRILASVPIQAARAVDRFHTAHQSQGTAHDFGPLETQLLEALLHMNEREAQRLLDQAFLSDTVEQVCLNLLQALLYRIGTLWEMKQISVTIEHFATSIIRTRLFAQFQSTPDLGQGPLILVGCAPKETHEIGALMLALFWRRAGMRVTYLGQMVQTKSLLDEIRLLKPGIVCLSAMTRPRVRDLANAAKAIAHLPPPKPLFCFGGGAFSRHDNLARKIEGIFLGQNASLATQRLREMLQQVQ